MQRHAPGYWDFARARPGSNRTGERRMRLPWSAERVLIRLATATLEGAWLTLINVSLQWLKRTGRVDLGFIHFTLAVLFGMFLALSFRHLTQTRYAAVLTAGAVGAGIIGALLSGA